MKKVVVGLMVSLFLPNALAETPLLVSTQKGTNFVIAEQVTKKPTRKLKRINLKVKQTNETSKKTN